MLRKLGAFLVVSLAVSEANAAEWFQLSYIDGGKALYFFDRETIVKKAGWVTVWIKDVSRPNAPGPDGSYSRATKYAFDCRSRTLQGLAEVSYDKQGDVLHSGNFKGSPFEAVPGSVGEALWKVACSDGFPKALTADYVRVVDNDVYSAAKWHFDKLAAQEARQQQAAGGRR